MNAVARRSSSPRLPDPFDWMDSPWGSLWPFGATRSFRVEDYTEKGNYVVRAELPDLDPDKDIDVTAEDGALTIHAERHEEQKDARRSEFRYGSMIRAVRLPAGADTERITAGYENGILKVIVPLREKTAAESHKITVSHKED